MSTLLINSFKAVLCQVQAKIEVQVLSWIPMMCGTPVNVAYCSYFTNRDVHSVNPAYLTASKLIDA